MKRKFVFLFLVVLCPFVFFSQDQDKEVIDWINQHPNVILIEKATFSSFSTEELEKLNGNYIVYSETLLLEDIQSYISKTNLPQSEVKSFEEKLTDEQMIKNWLGEHPHVKIVKQSEFQSEPSDIQREYQANGCLILIGEKITIEDIKNY